MNLDKLKDAIKALQKVRERAISSGNQDMVDACDTSLSLLKKEFYKDLDERDDNLIMKYLNSEAFHDMIDEDICYWGNEEKV